MTMLSFTDPFGFVENDRDERLILTSWRKGLDLFGFAGRFKFFHRYVAKLPGLGSLIFPKMTDETGMGWLMCKADEQVRKREDEIRRDPYFNQQDFLQQ